MWKSLWRQDVLKIGKRTAGLTEVNYHNYKMSKKEVILYLVYGVILVVSISYTFYNTWIPILCGLPLLPFYFNKVKEKLSDKRKLTLNIQFKDAILSIAAALKAGYSAENAIAEAQRDMKLLYGEHAMITKELKYINHCIVNSTTLEQTLYYFGERSDIGDIQSFAQVFSAAKRSGGDMITIIDRSVRMIGEKISVSQEIQVLMSAKRLEQKIMNVIPFFIIIYIRLSTPDFLEILYGNIAGVTIMTCCLILYFFAVYLSEHIMKRAFKI